MDNSILNTPKPQASSTVNRRPYESLPPVTSNVLMQSEVPSPSYLSNAIDGMRQLTDQLGTFHENSGNGLQQRLSSSHQIRKAASVADLHDDRRESAAAESEANSSLGILKLDDDQDILASSFLNSNELFANFRKEFSFLSQDGKENKEPINHSSKMSLSRLSLNEKVNKDRQAGSDISAKVLNSESRLSHRNSLSMQADLRLRLQKALAQRTIDRSMDSIRMSQMSEFDVDSVSMLSENEESGNTNQATDGTYFSNTEQVQSPASNATFGAANFLSFSGSPAVLDSSENFQPADLAMDRLKQDENSWRQHFEDLPVVPNSEKVSKDNVCELEHFTQNLDLSTMSGIISGEVTISSSIMEDVGKRRLSAGEYFKLHTEQLGGEDRPNFGNLIKSPPKRRPHPPLINMNGPQATYVDEVPTRDSGLNKTLNTSFADSMDFSASVISDAVCHPTKEHPASRSMDLMPPPPPRPRPSNAQTHPSDIRDSISTRLSMSLSLPRDSDAGIKDLNSSSLSLDSGEKFVSISQMVKIMQDLPSGPKSARQLVDDFMQKCRIPQSNPLRQSTGNESNKSQGTRNELNQTSSSKTTLKSGAGEIASLGESNTSPSRNQRVKDWVSSINNSGTESFYGNDDATTPIATKKAETTYDVKMTQTGNSGYFMASNNAQESNIPNGIEQKKTTALKKNVDSLKVAPEFCERDDESIASFMPPPSRGGIPSLAQLRNFSTPKAHAKRISRDPSSERTSINQVPIKGFSSQRINGSESGSGDLNSRMSHGSQGSDHKSVRFQGSHESSDSKHNNESSSQNHKSHNRRSVSQASDTESRAQMSDWKYHTSGERPPSNCGSSRSAISCSKSSSKQTDVASVTSGPLQIDSTHTQLSWASVSLASSVTHTFALRNRSSARVRLLVNSPNTAFKLFGERGEKLSELMLTLHSEETRRIHVAFSPQSIGPVVGKLVICRVATSESSASSSEDRRLIALYGYGGMAELAVEGASKDRWSQLFLNMCMADNDARHEVSDIDASNDAPQVLATFSVRNVGKVPAYISLQIAGELPFEDCGVYVTPKEVPLLPGEVSRIVVRFDPCRDILQWLNKNADDMQLLGNIWLSWSELATWQRIRRIYMKYYKSDKSGPLSSWGTLYSGDLGVGHELKDNKSSEAALAQAVRRLKVAVLIERERLNMFDMDATLVFDQLVANETAMFNSPQFNDRTMDSSDFMDSPILAGMPSDVFPTKNGDSPLSSVSTASKRSSSKQADLNSRNDLVVVTSVSCDEPQSYTLEFPPTTLGHKSKIKITFKNQSCERTLVSISDLSSPFSVSTPKFYVPSNSYVTMSVLFRPVESGTHHRTLSIIIDGNNARSYLLRGEGVHD